MILSILLCGCGTDRPASVQFSTLSVGYWTEAASEGQEESILAGIETGVLLTDEQAQALVRNNLTEYEQIAEEIAVLITDYRKKNGKGMLMLDATLSFMAMHRAAENAHMEWMEVTTDAEGTHHLRPDGTRVVTIFQDYELYGTYGEILGRRQESPSEVFMEWQLSQEHNDCMLSEDFTHFGVGVAQSAQGDFYYAVLFFHEKE